MQAYGLQGTLEKVRHANGPAQHLACAVCGLIMAGMFATHIETIIICAWGTMSLIVAAATVWLPRVILMYTLLLDFLLSMVVLFQYMMYEPPKPMENVYYTMTATGMDQATRPSMHPSMTTVDEISHAAALIWLAGWSLYLANLVHRQILEHKRFVDDH